MRKNIRVFLLLWASTMFFVGIDAYAFSIQRVGGSPLRWPASMSVVTYVVHQNGSADIQDGSDIAQVKKGFSDWQNHSCTDIQFSYGGTSTGKNVTPMGSWSNGKNEVVWIEDSTWTYGSYVLGVTSPIFSQKGAISEADIAFNGYSHSWSTSGEASPWGNTQDVLNVALHEQGHFLGMQHVLGGYSENDPPTMAPSADPYLKTATLSSDDIKGVCYLYPAGTHSCSSDADCPYVLDQYSNGQEYYKEKIQCEGGKCAGSTTDIPTGGKGLGESCTGDIDCDDPLFCQNTGQGSVCAQECIPSQKNCPSGFECYPYSNQENLGVCLPGSEGGGSSGNVPVGGSCDYSSDCVTGLCVQQADGSGNFCMNPCDVSAPDCPAGESCQPLAMGSNSGVCVPGGGGANSDLSNGAVCQSSDQCTSGLCVGMPGSNLFYCRAQCNPSSASSCLANETCWEIQGGGGACLPDEQTSGGETNGGGGGDINDGAPCSSPEDCKSGLCVGMEEGGGFFCRKPCNSQTGEGCAEDENCLALVGDTGDGACVPKEDAGFLNNGALCTSSTECKSGLCVGLPGEASKCRNSCDVVTGVGCADGENCQALSSDDGAGACFPASEGKATGESCTSSEQCFSGQCIGDGSGAGFCTGDCQSVADCPCGMVCADTTNMGLICFPSDNKVKCVGDGEPCETDGECVSLSCTDGLCETSCSIFSPADCPVGQGCKRLGLSPVGLCSSQGATGLGERCDSDVDCASLYCVLLGNFSYCQDPCAPADGSGCSLGQECTALEGVPDLGYCTEGSGEGSATERGGSGPGDGSGGLDSSTGDDGGCHAARNAPNAGRLMWLVLLCSGLWALRRRRETVVF